LRDDVLSGASRLEANTKKLPSRAQRGEASFFSFVKVSCFDDETPSWSETR
jgi:hypothetical protein